LRRDDGWKEFYTEKMNEVTHSRTPARVLDIFSAEMKAEKKHGECAYEEAVQIVQRICDKHATTLAEKGWYLQEMARYMYPLSQSRSNDLQVAAHKHNHYLLRPKHGMVISKVAVVSQKRVESLNAWVKSCGTFEELSLAVEGILGNLRFGVRAEAFEKALNDLAQTLGFDGQRPDKEWKAGPDNLWAVRDDEYLLFECKSEVKPGRAEINKDETGQMNNASAWFRQVYPGLKVKCVLIIPTKTLGNGAGFNEPVEIMRDPSLDHLTRNVRSFFNEFRNLDLSNLSETKTQSLLDMHKLGVSDLLSVYSEPPKSY
jgi:hypothetical protein